MTEGESSPPDSLRVFLSYARADRARAAGIAAALGGAGLDVWWDDRLQGGEAFAGAIESALEGADAVVVAWSATSVRSDWVRDEAGHGRDRKRLVALSLDGAPPPLGFGQYHSIDFARWTGRAPAPEIDRLLAAIRAVAAGAPAPGLVTTAPPSRRGLLIGAGTGVAAVAAGGGWWWLGSTGTMSADAHSIAVLPFDALGDRTQAYFSEGVAEELRSTLSRNPALRVAAQTSSNAFRSSAESAQAIARKLNVAYLLEGSCRRGGAVVRVAATLIDGRTGLSRWSDRFDRTLQDIFAVQNEIAATVAGALSAELAGTSTDVGGTRDPAAYDQFLKGKSLFDLAADEDSDRAALSALDAAVALDPRYAQAHALRSRALGVIGNLYARGEELNALYDASVVAAERAVALAPMLAGAQLALGFALFNGRMDVRGAREPYARARRLGAGDADVLILCALYAARTARFDEALEAASQALARDPLNARTHRAMGTVLYNARRFADVAAPLRESLRINPAIGGAHGLLGDARLALNDVAGAAAEYAREPSDLARLTGLAITRRRLGDVQGAQAALADVIARHGDNALYQVAQVRAQWNQPDAAFDALARARAARDTGVLLMRTDPLLDPIRRDPRLPPMLNALGFG